MVNFVNTLKEKTTRFMMLVDLPLLIFLLLILNVSLGIKLIGVALIYCIRPNFKTFFKGRLPLFYPLMMLLVIIQILFTYKNGSNYMILISLVFLYWTASFLIINQLRLAIEKQGIEKVENTLITFFILNAVVTAFNLVMIMLEIHTINPYTFIGLNFKYYDSTGDHIRGITGDLSTVNMIINSLGLFYFLYQKRYAMSALCFIVAVCTTSNLGNFILLLFFICILIFNRSKLNKSIILCYLGFLIVFVVKISPSNLNYLNNKFKSLLHLEKTPIQRRFEDNTEKEKLISNYANKFHKTQSQKVAKSLYSVRNLIIEKQEQNKIQEKADDSLYVTEQIKIRNRFVDFYTLHYGDTLTTLNRNYYNKYPGKYLSFLETFNYIDKSPVNLIIGAGGGNFSSKLAFKASNLGISGKYLEKYAYMSPAFKEDHLKLTLYYYLQPISEHSVLNFPNSVFNQLLGEYGLTGLILFLVTYVWFYLRKFKKLTYGRIILPVLLLFLLTDYWFESFSIVIIFELMMFIDLIKTDGQNEIIKA